MLLTLKEALAEYGSYYALRKKIAARELFKIESGLYSDRDEYVPGERLIQKKFPNKEVVGNYRSNIDRLYPAKVDEYLDSFPRREAISRQLNLEVF